MIKLTNNLILSMFYVKNLILMQKEKCECGRKNHK